MSQPAHAADVEAILAKRHHKGADSWATEDGRVYVGNPFSTLSSLGMLHELGVTARHPVVRDALELVLECWREDGRIRLAPKAPLYPCYTAEAARVLCRFGYADDPRVRHTVDHLLGGAHDTGGWRCNFTKFGRGPETECANPGATLFVLDVLRFGGPLDGPVVEPAVESLLAHWRSRRRCGPCHYGIGRRFLEVEYPFLRYNLFYWVYVLSCFPSARGDERLLEAFELLRSQLDDSGRLVVGHCHRGLRKLAFCRPGEPSEPATHRYREIAERLAS